MSSSELRDRLLDSAEALFAESSYRESTVAAICARAGMATGSFYSHFPSKHALFVELVRRINAELRRAMGEAIGDATDQREVERRAFRAFFDHMSKRPHVYRIVREAEFVAPGVFREYYERLARGYARGVREAQLHGDVDVRFDPELVAYVYMGIGYFVGMRWTEWTGGGVVPEDVLEDVLELLGRALEPAPR